MAKKYSQTYLFGQYAGYEKEIFKFIMNAERIDTKSSEFSDILFDIKRRNISDSLAKVVTSPSVILGIMPGNKGIPKAFKVFVAADAKERGTKPKVFIDVTEFIQYKNGIYVCSKIEALISYLISAITAYVYTMDETKILGNASILKDGCQAWVNCFSYIIDRMYKISTVQSVKHRVDYLAALYYQINIMGKSAKSDAVKANALKISNISDNDAKVVDIMLQDNDFNDINMLSLTIGRICGLKDMKLSNLTNLWMSAFGTGTVFALEYLPAFATMMTNTYVGAYLDNQMTIEKIAGTSMVKFTKTILEIGARVV